MHKHYANVECPHILKFCVGCGMVYCEVCGDEWVRPLGCTPIVAPSPCDSTIPWPSHNHP